jgi:hypothetical protein
MYFRIRWVRALAIASVLTLLVAGTMPASASAHGAKKVHAAKARATESPRSRAKQSAPSHAKPQVGEARARTLIFGEGDSLGGVTPSEPLTDLENILTSAGYGVDEDSTLPTSLGQYKAIWYIDTNPLTSSEETELEAFVNAGHGLYLSGERPCCEALNASDTSVIDDLVAGGGIQAGGQGDADDGTAPEAVSPDAIDDVAETPNVLTSWTPNEPGGMTGVSSANVLTSTNFDGESLPTGAVWDGSDMTNGKGRLAILMNIPWLESQYWDQTTATQMAVNLERFLMAATPVPMGVHSQWAGYAAKAHGVSDITGSWTVPSVDCTMATEASAVGIWVGIDGFGNKDLIKAGVGVTCASSTATPCYYLFTEVLPGAEDPFTGCSAVSPSDDLTVEVTNSPFGSSTFVVTFTDNGDQVDSPIYLTANSKRDKSAECIVQLPPGNVGPTPAHYTQLADFGSVAFTQCQGTATQNAGNSLDVDQLASGSDGAFTVTALHVGRGGNTKATTVAPDFPDPTWSVSWDNAS